MAQMVKNLTTVKEIRVRSLGQEDPLEEEMATYSNIHASRSPWTLARQAPLSMGFSSQEAWGGLPFPPPEDLPDPGIEPRSPTLHADS